MKPDLNPYAEKGEAIEEAFPFLDIVGSL